MFTTNSSFRGDLEFLLEKLKNRDKFAFSKYADGEYKILVNEDIKNCDGWKFEHGVNIKEYELLLDSFKYDHPDYYVGISCPCCQSKLHVNWMRDNVGTKNVTWANIFVNHNYSFFVDNFIPEFNKWEGKVTLFANEKGLNKELPFKVDNYIPLHLNSWKEPHLSNIIEETLPLSKEEDNQLFLFSAGPLGNILSYLMHSQNQNNTYLDIGSTINPWTVGNNRNYLNGKNNKVCRW
jgi:hypothetical protein